MTNLRWLLIACVVLSGCVDDEPDPASRTAELVAPGSGSRSHTTLAVGDAHVCVLTKLGTVRCWGRNLYGQLGNGGTTDSPMPVTVSGLSNVVAITAGAYHTCAIVGNGTVRCWGRNQQGQLGDGTTTQHTTPVTVSGLADVHDLAAGAYHTCAVRAHGTALCWGDNFDGQLGDGTNTDAHTPVSVAAAIQWKQIAAGRAHTCALAGNGQVFCWGLNASGQLGTGNTISRNSPFGALSMADMRQVVVGADHSCSLAEDGRAFCWGYNFRGQLGDGLTANRSTGAAVSGLSSVGYLAAGGHQTCAVRTFGGAVRCWGMNNAGQAGNGSTSPTHVLTPTAALGIDDATEVELGASSPDNYQGTACVVRGGGDVACWGFGLYGQMGNGTTAAWNLSPVVPAVGATARSTVSLAVQGKTIVVRPDGTSRAWQWTPGVAPAPTPTMAAPPRLVATTSIYSCAILADGRTQCWGDNSYGQLGDGTLVDRATPTDVIGTVGLKAVHLDVSDLTSCAVLTDGGVRCWGAGEKLGDGGPMSWYRREPTPVSVAGLEDAAVQVGIAGETACALLVDGRVTCWGNGYGSGSTGSAGDPPKPMAELTAPLSAPAIALSSGNTYAGADGHCALLTTGQVQCWGWYPGNGGSYSDVPATISLGAANRAVAVDTGGDVACVILDDGTVKCWGENLDGQLGIGFTSAPFYFPVAVPGLANVIAISVGGGNSGQSRPGVCAITASGQVSCWGYGYGSSPVLQLTL